MTITFWYTAKFFKKNLDDFYAMMSFISQLTGQKWNLHTHISAPSGRQQ
jgi:hypothetical protein